MSFTFNCPFCNQSLEAEEQWIGQETECPLCAETIKIIKPENSTVNTEQAENQVLKWKQTDVEEAKPKPTFTKIFLFLQIVFYILGFILLLFADIPFIIIPIIMSFIYFFLPKGGLKFHLLAQEKLLFTCHATGKKDDDECPYYIRMTNKRIVLSEADYAMLPHFLADIVELIQRPSSVDIEWGIEEIDKIEVKDGGLFSYPNCFIKTKDTALTLTGRYVKNISKWWDNQLS